MCDSLLLISSFLSFCSLLCLSASADQKKRKHSGSSTGSGPASLSSSPPTSSLLSSMVPAAAAASVFDYSTASLPPSNPQKAPHFTPYADMGRDKAELKAAAMGPGARSNDPSQKIYKNHTMLKNAHKNVTVKMDDQRSRTAAAAAAAGGIPIPAARNQQQQRR